MLRVLVSLQQKLRLHPKAISMRHRKANISQVIKSDLKIEFAPQDISAHSGLELFRRYFHIIGLNNRIRRAFRGHCFKGDYSIVQFIMVLISLWLTGGRRLRHIPFLSEDPLVQRLCGLHSLPSDRTVSRWLGQFTNDALQALVELNSQIVLEKLDALGLPRVTLEFDGTVLSCGDKVQWSARGYNPMNRHAQSYFPLLCHVAQTGHFLQVKNRPGNVHDAKGGALSVIRSCIQQVRKMFPHAVVEVRLDSAFFQEEIIKYLLRENVEFAIKVPMWKWLGLKDIIANTKCWQNSDPKLAYFFTQLKLEQWDLELPLCIYRHKLSDKLPSKGHQLDFFTPDDGIYEYSVLLSNKSLSAENLLHFYNGRCQMEAHIAELKGEFAFDVIPTRHYQGNSAHQQISLLAYNLVKNFQIDTESAQARPKTCRRTSLFEFNSLKTIRFELIHAAGRILNTAHGRILRVTHNAARKNRYEDIESALDKLKAA